MTRRSRTRLCTLAAAGAAVAIGLAGCRHTPSEAEKKFIARIGDLSITVYPAFVRVGKSASYDPQAAVDIADFLKADKLAGARVSEEQPPITGPWHMNQLRMYRESQAEFAAWVKAHPPETEYAMMAEYLKGKPDGDAGGVHGYLIDRDGVEVHIVLLNSHHEVFSKAAPKSTAECTEVLIAALRQDMEALRGGS